MKHLARVALLVALAPAIAVAAPRGRAQVASADRVGAHGACDRCGACADAFDAP